MTTVQYGASGSAVLSLQSALKNLGYNVGSIDGKFGPQTQSAVKDFQSDHSLTVDGVVGSQTWTQLDLALQDNGLQAVSTSIVGDTPSQLNTSVRTPAQAQAAFDLGTLLKIAGGVGGAMIIFMYSKRLFKKKK